MIFKTVPSLVRNVHHYHPDEAPAKTRTRGVVAEHLLDLQPFNSVNRPGYLWHSMALDPRYQVKSSKYYTSLCDKV